MQRSVGKQDGILFLVSWLGLMVVYFFPLSHFTLSIDGEFEDNFQHTIALGRWGHAFLRAWLLPEPYIPYFTLVMALALLALAAVIGAAMLKLPLWQGIAFSAVFASTPQLAYQLQFINQADTVAVGYVLMVVGVALFQRSLSAPGNRWRRSLWLAGAVVCWVCAMAIYQSLVILAPVMWMGMLLLAPEARAMPIKRQFASLCGLGASLAVAALLYVVLSRWLQAYLVGDASYAQLNEGYLERFVLQGGELGRYLQGLVRQVAVLLSGRAYYGAGTLLLVTLAALVSLLLLFRRPGRTALWRGLLLVGILITPISLALTSNSPLPARVWVGFNLMSALIVTWLLSQLSGMPQQRGSQQLQPAIALPARVLLGAIGIVTLVHIAWISALFSSDHHLRQRDILMANRIMTSAYMQYPEVDLARTPVYFHGGWQQPSRHTLPNAGTFGGSFFAWDGGNNIRLERFFAYYGIAHFSAADRAATRKALAVVGDMPTWPNPGAIQLLDGVLVIKLGEHRGWLPFSVDE